jgi:regulatory protein
MPLRSDRATSEDAAKEAALRILERGPKTVREVFDRLLARGFVQDAVERAVERLRRVSLLDDRAFMRSFLRTEIPRRPQGRRLLVLKLKRRGIPAGLLEELDRLLAEDPDLAERSLDTEEGRARAAMAEMERRHARRDAAERARRVQGALIRRGFDWSTVRDIAPYRGDESQEPH